MSVRVKVESSWDALRDKPEGLPGRRMNLEKMNLRIFPGGRKEEEKDEENSRVCARETLRSAPHRQ